MSVMKRVSAIGLVLVGLALITPGFTLDNDGTGYTAPDNSVVLDQDGTGLSAPQHDVAFDDPLMGGYTAPQYDVAFDGDESLRTQKCYDCQPA